MERPGAWFLPGLLAGTAVGIGAGDAVGGEVGPLPAAAGVALALVGGTAAMSGGGTGRRRAILVLGWALACGLTLGLLRGPAAAPPTGPGTVSDLDPDAAWDVIGRVAEEPVPRGERQDLIIDDMVAGGRPVRGRVLVRVPRAIAALAGDVVAASVQLREPDPGEPGEIAYRERLRRQGIGAVGDTFAVRVVGHAADPLTDGLRSLRARLLDAVMATIPEPEASLGAGILLGVRAGIDPAIRDAFAVAGLSHVVAISGWNVALVVALIGSLARPLRARLGAGASELLAVAAIAVFVVLVGASPAVVRAALMASGLIVSRVAGSPAHAASALMAAVAAMLLVTPAALWDVGFQLSALATGGLIVLGGPLERMLARWPGWVRTPVALTMAAQLATLPVLLGTFGQVSVVAPFANVAVVPLVPVVMAGCAAAAMVGVLATALPLPALWDAAGWLAGGAAWLSLRGLIEIGTVAASVPLAAIPFQGGPVLAVIWYPSLALVARHLHRPRSPHATSGPPAPQTDLPELAAFAAFSGWLARPRHAAVLVIVVVASTSVLGGPDGHLHLTVLDIGQGDAILIRAPDGRATLVDAGVDPDVTLRRIGRVLPHDVRTLDLVVLTHPHQDHLGGLGDVLRRYTVRRMVDPGRLVETGPHRALLVAAGREPGLELLAAQAGQVLALGGGAQLTILFPAPADRTAPLPDGDVNNGSVVALLRYGEFSALLTGDAEAPVEELLLRRGTLEPVDVLKVGHHGSDSSTTPAFLARVRPSVALISAGVDNAYGHPHRSTLDNLTQVPGLAVYRTDVHGTLDVASDGRSWWVATERGATSPAASSTAWQLAPTGTIGAWLCPTAPPPFACWPPSTLPTGWSSTRPAWPGWPPRRHRHWPPTRSGPIPRWRRRPASFTTSTSSTPGGPGVMEQWAPSASRPWATGSWRTRSPPTRSPASWTRPAHPAAGRPSASRWPTGGWA